MPASNNLVEPDLLKDYIVSGCQAPTGSQPGLSLTTPAGVAYLSGNRTSVVSSAFTYSANSDTYDCLQTNGTWTHTAVANGGTQPTLTGIYAQKIVTNGTQITSVTPQAAALDAPVARTLDMQGNPIIGGSTITATTVNANVNATTVAATTVTATNVNPTNVTATNITSQNLKLTGGNGVAVELIINPNVAEPTCGSGVLDSTGFANVSTTQALPTSMIFTTNGTTVTKFTNYFQVNGPANGNFDWLIINQP